MTQKHEGIARGLEVFECVAGAEKELTAGQKDRQFTGGFTDRSLLVGSVATLNVDTRWPREESRRRATSHLRWDVLVASKKERERKTAAGSKRTRTGKCFELFVCLSTRKLRCGAWNGRGGREENRKERKRDLVGSVQPFGFVWICCSLLQQNATTLEGE